MICLTKKKKKKVITIKGNVKKVFVVQLKQLLNLTKIKNKNKNLLKNEKSEITLRFVNCNQSTIHSTKATGSALSLSFLFYVSQISILLLWLLLLLLYVFFFCMIKYIQEFLPKKKNIQELSIFKGDLGMFLRNRIIINTLVDTT